MYPFYAAEGLWRAQVSTRNVARELDIVLAEGLDGPGKWTPGVIKTLAGRVRTVAEYTGRVGEINYV